MNHILEAIHSITQYTANEDLKSFLKNNLLQDAVLRQFTIIGEAIIHFEIEKLNKYNYPWYKIRAFRNMIAHEYFNIKIDAVWLIIDQELPLLRKKIAEILDNEF